MEWLSCSTSRRGRQAVAGGGGRGEEEEPVWMRGCVWGVSVRVCVSVCLSPEVQDGVCVCGYGRAVCVRVRAGVSPPVPAAPVEGPPSLSFSAV